MIMESTTTNKNNDDHHHHHHYHVGAMDGVKNGGENNPSTPSSSSSRSRSRCHHHNHDEQSIAHELFTSLFDTIIANGGASAIIIDHATASSYSSSSVDKPFLSPGKSTFGNDKATNNNDNDNDNENSPREVSCLNSRSESSDTARKSHHHKNKESEDPKQ
mmetsp:Transcript_45651/g.49280  ORF Transcript_45651/g.49280 Transcript_45651/m.49280 type:complete len:161 (-) Transcript_45651:60-542(-)